MTADFEWKEEYSVGVEILDAQHQYMFALGRQINALKPDKTKELVVDLYRYIMQHFTAEELHMQTIGFPGLDDHRKHHEYIIEQLNEMTTGFEPTERNTLKLKLFVFNWLTAHIMNEDKKYFDFAHLREAYLNK